MAQYHHIEKLDFTFIGHGSNLEGVFHFKGNTRLSANLKGEIHIQNKEGEQNTHHLLVIESDGIFEGEIFCGDLEVYGEVTGNINSSGKVIIYPNAHFKGEVNSSSLIIHPGAQLEMEAHAKGAEG